MGLAPWAETWSREAEGAEGAEGAGGAEGATVARGGSGLRLLHGELDGLGAEQLRVDWAALESLPLANGWRHLPDGYAPIVAAADAPPLPQPLQRAGEAAAVGEAAAEAGEEEEEEEAAAAAAEAAAAARRHRAFLATLAQGMQTELEEVTLSLLMRLPLATEHSPLTTHPLLRTPYYSPLTTHPLLLTPYYRLLTITAHYLPR